MRNLSLPALPFHDSLFLLWLITETLNTAAMTTSVQMYALIHLYINPPFRLRASQRNALGVFKVNITFIITRVLKLNFL